MRKFPECGLLPEGGRYQIRFGAAWSPFGGGWVLDLNVW
jgi:hypothetical protein